MKIYLAGGVEANLKPLWKEEISKKYGGVQKIMSTNY